MTTSVRFSIRVSRAAAPIVMDLIPNSPTISLCFRILSLFDRSLLTDIHLRRLDNRQEELLLSSLPRIDSRFNSAFLISFTPISLDVENTYQTMLTIEPTVSDRVASDAFQRLLMHHKDQMTEYTSFVYRHLILTFALNDLVNGKPNFFCSCLPFYFARLSPSDQLFPPELLESAFSSVFASNFADRFLWNDSIEGGHPLLKMCKTRDLKLKSFCAFLIRLVIEGSPIRQLIRKVVGVYRPSYFVPYFVYCFTQGLLERLDASRAFGILLDIFKDNWLYDSFPDATSRRDFIYIESFLDLFPFFGVRVGFEEILQHIDSLSSPLLMYYMSQKPAFHTLNFTKVVSTSLLTHIYRTIQKDEIVPVLLVSQSLCEELSALWNHLRPVLKGALAFCQEAQLMALDIVARFWKRHGFEPKGFCYMTFAQMANAKLVDEILIRTWFTTSQVVPPIREALLIELNTFFLSVTPDELLAVADEPATRLRTIPPNT
jgi:hypothetical protein